jgi:hypothetical protein
VKVVQLVLQIAAGFVLGSLTLELLGYIGQFAAKLTVRVVCTQLKKAQERTATRNSSPS